MTKIPKNSNLSPLKILAVGILFVLVIITSELIYQLGHDRERLFYTFFKTISVSKSGKDLGETYNGFVAQSFYTYFSYLDKSYPPGKPCSPFCLQFEVEQAYLDLFKTLLSKEAFKGLNADKKAKLYFWMSDINIWNKDDQTTLLWLKEGLSFSPDERYEQFYEDLKGISLIESSPEKRQYFTQKLASADKNLERTQRLYLAKAAQGLARFCLGEQELELAEKYSQTSIFLNPWNIDYYLTLSDIYLSKGETIRAKEPLSACIEKIPQDSGACKQRLTSLNNE
jgi:tetratricopeptide (TPR) repeat protein